MLRILGAVSIALIGVAAIVFIGDGERPADAREGANGLFRTSCPLSHRGPDDPIVYPGRPGRSHMHDFFGNRSTDASSTPASLAGAPTTCARKMDRSAYWVPTLYEGGKPVAAAEVKAYYSVTDRDPDSIRPFPPGLRMIAGDAGASDAQPGSVLSWGCKGAAPIVRGGSADAPEHAAAVRTEIARSKRIVRRAQRAQRRTPARLKRDLDGLRNALELYLDGGESVAPICPPKAELELHLRFPNCWDGRNLDSSDHSSHMAYAETSRPGVMACPASHPVPVPKLALQIRYPTVGGPDVQLASGDADTGHGDFMNGWDQPTQERLVRACLNDNVYCADGDGRRRRDRR